MYEIKLNAYKASAGGFQILQLGTKDSYGVERLKIIPGPDWAGMVITATFSSGGKVLANPVVVPDDGVISVPAGATAQAITDGAITFRGVSDGVQRITADFPYTVATHGPVDGTAPAPEPGPWEQFVSQVKDDADRAEKAANDAEAALDNLSGQADRAEAAADRAAQSAADAAAELGKVQNAGTDALGKLQSAGASELDKVQGAGQDALTEIGNAQTTALNALREAQQTGVGEVQTAELEAEKAIDQARQNAVQAVEQAGSTQTGAVSTAGQAQQTAIQQAGTAQVDAVNAAGDAKLAEINAANALLPTPTEADAGKAPIAQPDGTYALEKVTVDAYTKAESDARYAPIEAAIKVSSKGTGLVSLSPTVPWKLQGLKLYGRSTQDGTPSVENPVPIQNAGQDGQVDVQITDGGSQSQQLVVPTPDGLPGIPVYSGGNWVDENGQQWVSDVIDLAVRTKKQNAYVLHVSDYLSGLSKSSNLRGDTYFIAAPNASILTIPDKDNGRSSGMLCNYFKAGSAYASEMGFDIANIGLNNVTQHIRFCFGPIGSMPTLENAKVWFEAHDVVVMYPLATPIITPLDDETIAAYHALQTYPGTTNVIAPDAGIEASALAEPNQYIEDRIQAAITQAVSQAVTLTGGTT